MQHPGLKNQSILWENKHFTVFVAHGDVVSGPFSKPLDKTYKTAIYGKTKVKQNGTDRNAGRKKKKQDE